MPRSKKNKRAANASEGGKPDQESVMEDQAADELNSMEEEVHKQEGDYAMWQTLFIEKKEEVDLRSIDDLVLNRYIAKKAYKEITILPKL